MKRGWFVPLLLSLIVSACAPAIRYKPGEIPVPSATAPEMLAAGQEMYQKAIASGEVLRDPRQEQRVASIIERLLGVTPSTGHWKVLLIDDPAFNAMTAPGNHIYVFRGLLERLQDDGEVAAVLAHEIAHRLAQHEVKSGEERLGEGLAMLAVIAAGAAVAAQEDSTAEDVEGVMGSTMVLGQGFTSLRYSKDKEREADLIGMFLLADAGFDPIASARVWVTRMASGPNESSDFFSTHPLSSDRYNAAIELVPQARVRYQQAISRRTDFAKQTNQSVVEPSVRLEVRMGEEALRANDLQRASIIAHSIVERNPTFPEGLNLLGLVHFKSGDVSRAKEAFSQGLKIEPDSHYLIYNVGCMHAMDGRANEALDFLNRAFSLDPSLQELAETDPDLASLRSDSRFTALLRKEYPVVRSTNVGGNSFSIN